MRRPSLWEPCVVFMSRLRRGAKGRSPGMQIPSRIKRLVSVHVDRSHVTMRSDNVWSQISMECTGGARMKQSQRKSESPSRRSEMLAIQLPTQNLGNYLRPLSPLELRATQPGRRRKWRWCHPFAAPNAT